MTMGVDPDPPTPSPSSPSVTVSPVPQGGEAPRHRSAHRRCARRAWGSSSSSRTRPRPVSPCSTPSMSSSLSGATVVTARRPSSIGVRTPPRRSRRPGCDFFRSLRTQTSASIQSGGPGRRCSAPARLGDPRRGPPRRVPRVPRRGVADPFVRRFRRRAHRRRRSLARGRAAHLVVWGKDRRRVHFAGHPRLAPWDLWTPSRRPRLARAPPSPRRPDRLRGGLGHRGRRDARVLLAVRLHPGQQRDRRRVERGQRVGDHPEDRVGDAAGSRCVRRGRVVHHQERLSRRLDQRPSRVGDSVSLSPNAKTVVLGVAHAGPSVVKITALGCGDEQEGSGFVTTDGLC